MSRRNHYSTALTQALSIIPESLSLFEIWEPGQSSSELFEVAQATNALNIDSERRLRNIIFEGFASRFLREPYLAAAPDLKNLFCEVRDPNASKQIILLYALRQHGIFFDFLTEEYWPSVRAGASRISKKDIFSLIDKGALTGKIAKTWSESVRKRVASYVLGISSDFEFLDHSRSGDRTILNWTPEDALILYLTYDLHFLGASDDEIANADEWKAFGLRREDVTIYLNRLQSQGHIIVQDTGHLCRIDWNYTTREQLHHVLTQ